MKVRQKRLNFNIENLASKGYVVGAAPHGDSNCVLSYSVRNLEFPKTEITFLVSLFFNSFVAEVWQY